jgi:methyltransferase (TIGR00027 family)
VDIALSLSNVRRQTARLIPGRESRTAQYVALFRALESQRPPAARLFADPLAECFLDRRLRAVVAAAGLPLIGQIVPWLLDRWIPGPRPSAVARTRFIDDALLSALAEGARQVVILGAGYDSRAYRLPDLRHLHVFEVDHPDTQAIKRVVIERELGSLPAHVSFVPVDFDREPLADTLAPAGLQVGVATFTIWEGVAS